MTADRVTRIQTALERRFAPEQLRIDDESAAHVGHPGAREGGHFRVFIVSAQFRGHSRVQRHRLVYEAVGDLMKTDIHALAIDARTPEEVT